MCFFVTVWLLSVCLTFVFVFLLSCTLEKGTIDHCLHHSLCMLVLDLHDRSLESMYRWAFIHSFQSVWSSGCPWQKVQCLLFFLQRLLSEIFQILPDDNLHWAFIFCSVLMLHGPDIQRQCLIYYRKHHEWWKYEIQLWDLTWSCGASVYCLTWQCFLQIWKAGLLSQTILIHTFTHAYMCTSLCLFLTHACTHTHTINIMHMYAHTHTYACTHAHTHTHSHSTHVHHTYSLSNCVWAQQQYMISRLNCNQYSDLANNAKT